MSRPQTGAGEEPATLTEAVHARIRGDILLGVLRPGARLKLDALRADYDASINTLRETLTRLAAEGLVASEGQKGFQVVPASLADLRDITEMRCMLEVEAARRSLARADLDWESRLVGAHHKLAHVEALVDSDPAGNSDRLEAYNRAFTRCSSRAAARAGSEASTGSCTTRAWRYRMLAFEVRDFPRDQSRAEHREILDAALARDADRLARVLAAHITKGLGFYAEEDLAAAPKARRGRPRATPA